MSGRYRLGDLIKKKGRTFRYLYDFGDGWDHELMIEDSGFDNSERWADVFCLEGENSCPPEDVGGPPGYSEFCAIMGNPGHNEHEAFIEWYGGEF